MKIPKLKLTLYLKKAITWRAIASVITMVYLYWATGSIDATLKFGASEAVVKIIAYVIHEKGWERWIRQY